MGQSWQVVAPEKEERFEWQGYGLKLGEFIFTGVAENMIVHLTVPQADRVERMLLPVPLYRPSPTFHHRTHSNLKTFPENTSQLVNLPTELLDEIISRLRIDSLFCLATCFQRLFYLCRNRIVSLMRSQYGRLAGTSLICVGDYLAAGDYPPGIDWQPKMDELQKRYQEDSDCSDGHGTVGTRSGKYLVSLVP
jgi:hypothetical protein